MSTKDTIMPLRGLANLLLFALCTAAGFAHAAEQRVTIAPDVSGTWVTPDSNWDGRTVLMLHGFADDMDGAGDLSKRMAGRLAQMGIATLRINFRGEGDRLRSNIESTLQSRIADTETAYAFLSKQPGVRAGHTAVLGWSLGATTALVVGGMHPAWFRSMVLWSTPSGEQFGPMSASPAAQKALREGVASDIIPGWKTIVTKRAFYESFRGVDLDQSLARYPGALLTVRGSKDFLPQRDAQLLNIAPGSNKEAALIGGADHVFNVFEPGSDAPQRVLELSAAWLARSL
ncbi:MAG: alpha/beta hydrolase [Pseudomonadota bacterium]